MNEYKDQRGFTLVEILTAVAIISVLAAVIFPVVNGVRGRAKHTACAENLHQLGAALMIYANDHEGWLPPATTEEFLHSKIPNISLTEVKRSPEVLRTAMALYVKNSEIWFCPADPQARKDILWLGQRHLVSSYRFDPMTLGQPLAWPPAMQIGRDPIANSPKMSEDVPLLSDAVGLPSTDSDPLFRGDEGVASNHSDGLVNAVRHDLSLSRISAKRWTGASE